MLKKGILQHNVPLARLNAWRVGGCAEQLYWPKDLNDLKSFLGENKPEDLTWLGLGSNVLIPDIGLSGTVILTSTTLRKVEVLEPTMVRAEAGLAAPQLARFCAKLGCRGLEFMAGIPGTVGGALAMNAGAFGGETWEQVVAVETIDRSGSVHLRTPEQFQVGYRSVQPNFKGEWFVAGHFSITSGNSTEALKDIKSLLAKRSATQPTGQASCGSVFTNPTDYYAGRLIESLGLKSHRIGGAEVSEKHANFIINTGDATARDIAKLITFIQAEVQEKADVALVPECHFLGEINGQQ